MLKWKKRLHMAIYVYNCDLRDFDAAQIIAQQCNCVTNTAKGLSASIAERFPYADFYSDNPQRVPGTIELRGGDATPKRWVCAMYAQYHPGKSTGKDGDTVTARSEWFKQCLERLAKVKNLRSIAFPRKIGCGLAGGNWATYRAIIDNWVAGLQNIKVYLVSNECFEDAILKLEVAPKAAATPAEKKEDTTQKNVPVTYSTMTILDFVATHFPKQWTALLKRLLDGGYLDDVSKFIAKEAKEGKTIYPPLPLLFNALSRVAPQDIKVVIVGQDPYHGEGQAIGVSFSVSRRTMASL